MGSVIARTEAVEVASLPAIVPGLFSAPYFFGVSTWLGFQI